MHVRRVILLLLGETTPRRARVRCRGSCCCEQRADWYYWFTLEGEAGLCVGHASVHSDSGSRAWGSGGCARARVVLNSSSTGCVSATPPSIAIAAPVLGGPEVVRVVLNRFWFLRFDGRHARFAQSLASLFRGEASSWLRKHQLRLRWIALATALRRLEHTSRCSSVRPGRAAFRSFWVARPQTNSRSIRARSRCAAQIPIPLHHLPLPAYISC